jgi:hypothetical protein
MISKNIDDVSRLTAMLKGSDVEVAMKELLVVEKRKQKRLSEKFVLQKKFRPRYGQWPCPKRVGRKISILVSHLMH